MSIPNYENDVFYETDGLTFEQKKEMLLYIKSLNPVWWVDIKEADSWHRKYIDMGFEEIFNKFKEDDYFNIIYRKGFKDQHKPMSDQPFNHKRWCLEVGFTTSLSTPAYYLWMYLPEDKVDKIINKYNLKPIDYADH